METFVSYLLAAGAGLLAIPVAVFCLEIVASIALPLWPRAIRPGQELRRRVAVLVPAHNESAGLLPTLTDIKSQLLPGDRLLVVADNCTDDTANVALAGRAEVVERHDLARHGKGYALDFGVRHLGSDPPEVVIFIDADCRIAADTINQLARTCATTHRPAQALYLMTTPEKSQINYQVAEFAWRVKNWLRPSGLSALGLPCQLLGTGMAFPWDVIQSADLASGWIVEDLKLGLDLALMGYPPLFCPCGRITSEFAASSEGAEIQRKRWEQGHIHTIINAAPRLLWRAFVQRNWGLLALALDLAVPPLSLLGMLVIGMFLLSTLAALFRFSSAAMVVSAVNLLALLLSAFLAWLKCGRDILPVSAILSISPYVLGKFPLYRQILSGKRVTRWIRTDRTKSD